jgi:MazG family protein
MEYPQLKRAIEVIAKLRDPQDGCPWDLKQDHQSLLKYLVEESYEYLHSVESGDTKKMEEELGDVLLQILLHSQIASESNYFDIESVAKTLADKMIHRHPHVFKDKSLASSAEDVRSNWEELKQKENKDKYYINTDDTHMPALMSAHKIGAKSQRVNFDWENIGQVADKVAEEWEEVKAEMEDIDANRENLKEELGDLLFSVAQLTRHLGFEAEEVLRLANQKFIKRFNILEDKVRDCGQEMTQMTVPELEEVWQSVKKELKQKRL